MKQRIALLVYVDLDPMMGPFHTEESALNNIAGILDNQIDHYNPLVAHAPDSLQPPNCPPRNEQTQTVNRPSIDLGHVLVDPGYPNDLNQQHNNSEIPVAGHAPAIARPYIDNDQAPQTITDTHTTYTEGYSEA